MNNFKYLVSGKIYNCSQRNNKNTKKSYKINWIRSIRLYSVVCVNPSWPMWWIAMRIFMFNVWIEQHKYLPTCILCLYFSWLMSSWFVSKQICTPIWREQFIKLMIWKFFHHRIPQFIIILEDKWVPAQGWHLLFHLPNLELDMNTQLWMIYEKLDV